MRVKILKECGYDIALLGCSLSRNQPVENMVQVVNRLAPMDGGHNKFLEFISVWIDITAPRYWWQQMATYRIGNSWLSESTMYTILKNPLTQENFEEKIDEDLLRHLNELISRKSFEQVKNSLPEGFLQRRIMITNYKALRNIYGQRKFHKLPQWKFFCKEIESQLEHPDFLNKEKRMT